MKDILALSSARSANKQAALVQREGEVEKKAEDVAATQREADRKQRLAYALSAQVAKSSGRGVSSFEGSPLSVLDEASRREGEATAADRFNSRISGLSAQYRADNKSYGIKSRSRRRLLEYGVNRLSGTGKGR